MTQFQSQFMQRFAERGYLYQATNAEELDKLACNNRLIAYIGFDATANSLHVGSLVQIMMLRLLQKCGHKPIILMGGGTSLVGDPSGKDESRRMLTTEDIDNNINGIKKVFSQFLKFGDGASDAVIVNNADWLCSLNYIDFLRDIGKHFSVNRMVGFESVKLRLEREQALSFLEFNYMVLQAYDFLELARRESCCLQIGGADQWGNIVCGIDLARRVGGLSLYGLTSPLLTMASGAKMGKSEGGAIWLNEDRLSVYDYWQYWRNVEDADVGRFLRLFTDLSGSEIVRLESLSGSELNSAKVVLADSVCALCHGVEAANRASVAAAEVFAKGGVSADMPIIKVNYDDLTDMGLLKFLTVANLTKSNSEGRRLVIGKALRIDGKLITNPEFRMAYNPDRLDIKISIGKKKHVIVRIKPIPYIGED